MDFTLSKKSNKNRLKTIDIALKSLNLNEKFAVKEVQGLESDNIINLFAVINLFDSSTYVLVGEHDSLTTSIHNQKYKLISSKNYINYQDNFVVRFDMSCKLLPSILPKHFNCLK